MPDSWTFGLTFTEILLIDSTTVRLFSEILKGVGRNPKGIDAWLEVLHKKLPGYEVPRRIVTVGEIPRNTSFKPDRIAVMRLLNDGGIYSNKKQVSKPLFLKSC